MESSARSLGVLLVTNSACQNLSRYPELSKLFEVVRVSNFDSFARNVDVDRVVGLWLNFDTVVTSVITDLFSNLRFIATTSTGLDHLQTNYGSEAKIKVISLDSELGELEAVTSTAELTWALIMAQFARVDIAHRDVLRGNWDRSRHERGVQLSEQTIAVIGFGRIGRRVAAIASGFGMRVLVSEKKLKRRKLAQEAGYRVETLEKIVSEADWVALHVNAAEENADLIGWELLENARPFHLVNTSRGTIVSETAVLRALEEGRLLSYSADVLRFEISDEGVKSSQLWQRARVDPRILLTPHIGGASRSAYEIVENVIVNKVVAFTKIKLY